MTAVSSEAKLQKKTVENLSDLHGKRVLVRVDFNVPMADGKITDDTRIRESLPTIKYLLARGARVIVMSHLGRPKGKVDPNLSLRPVTERLQELLIPASVTQADAVISPEVTQAVNDLQPGEVLVLENVRFEPGEEKNDPELAQKLADLADVYVNDAFGSAHRAHASTEGVAHKAPISVAGLLMAKEIQALSSVVSNPQQPFVAIIGGSKVSTKITVLEQLLDKVKTLVIGGGMIFTFLKAQGYSVGSSLVEDELVGTAKALLEQAKTKGVQLYLPADIVIADAFKADAQHQVVPADRIPEGWMGLDVGSQSVQAIQNILSNAKTVLWNGPLGVFEFPAFAKGTQAVAETLAELTQKGQVQTILGGGDTVSAIEQFDISPERYTHVSTGGGASIEFIEGKTLPGIAALDDAS